MPLSTTEQKTYYILRIAVAMCFIGHGAFGVITKPIWCNYFAVFGIGHNLAYRLMPVLGTADIVMGLMMLVYPIRAIAMWLVFWGLITAALRPLSGEPFAELIERAGNFGAPLALLLLSGGQVKNLKHCFTKIEPKPYINNTTILYITNCLRITVFLLFIGHGWLNMAEKKGLLSEYASLGFSNPAGVAHIVGLLEELAACIVLLRPIRSLLLVFLVWKIISELFYPHWEIFEWIERGGSYGTLLALYLIIPGASLLKQNNFFANPIGANRRITW